ncbi:gsr3096 [Gloeobacter violaceus PCC 7421]|uniref:Gsr3096 protein n=1 Tax=Gloeobacter violaceus (strain ATCC 29082 / PCC 7421) TaxID=251221 RepID=Q7NC83_GLOVI|nr:gsr3096 [Gloeobacter violaceus PCC 7421]
MTENSALIPPRYQENQSVSFLGGAGRIRDCHFIKGTWDYIVEMEFGQADRGRLGDETAVLLPESELEPRIC